MKNHLNKSKNISMNSYIICFASLILTAMIQTKAYADATSIGKIKNQWDEKQALSQLKEADNRLPIDINKQKLGKSREQVIALKAEAYLKQIDSLIGSLDVNFTSSSVASKTLLSNETHHSFTIHNAYSQLIEDNDEDGYYQTFSITFDADVYSTQAIDHASVYAELYLSKNGGDWLHYYSTDNFVIYGESEDDQYEVYTTLDQGYIPEGYDVLVDLYEVGYSNIVATYSSNDTVDLSALPLESRDYDPDYVEYHTESHSHGHGGSHSFLLLSIMLVGLFIKMFRTTIRKPK